MTASLTHAIAHLGRTRPLPTATDPSSHLVSLLDRVSTASLTDLTATTDYGITPLHCAIYFSLPTLTSAILRRLAALTSADPTTALSTYLHPTPTCPSPLMLAALLGAHDVLRDLHALLPGKQVAKLINQPFPINGWTALHFASVAERHRIATICALGEEPGADFAARSWNGTPVFPVALTVGEAGASQSESLDATLISSIASRAGWGLGKVAAANENEVNAAVVGQS